MQFKGIKLHQCWEYFKVDSDWFREVTDWCVNKNLPTSKKRSRRGKIPKVLKLSGKRTVTGQDSGEFL